MDEVSSDTIDLIVSGPPYWDYIDYHAFHGSSHYKDFTWRRRRPYQEFLGDIDTWYSECYRVLRSGRYCVVAAGTIRNRGKCYPLPFHVVGILEEIGFEFCYEIIWHKITGGRPHAGMTIQNPYPGYYLPNNKTEYLLVFKKNRKASFANNDNNDQTSPWNKFEVDELFKREIANNVWHILPSCFPLNGEHPCPFPPEIPYRLIKLLSLKGETILDPFMGIGTTARAARMLGRHFVGYEVEPEFVKKANREIAKPLKMRRPSVINFSPLKKDSGKKKIYTKR